MRSIGESRREQGEKLLKGRIAKKDGALTLDLFPDAYFMKYPSFLQQNASLRGVVSGDHLVLSQ
eukprot:scaffold2037_cov247-Chaetoceros_neogracile.AAC.3